jgi:hypothetical protein
VVAKKKFRSNSFSDLIEAQRKGPSVELQRTPTKEEEMAQRNSEPPATSSVTTESGPALQAKTLRTAAWTLRNFTSFTLHKDDLELQLMRAKYHGRNEEDKAPRKLPRAARKDELEAPVPGLTPRKLLHSVSTNEIVKRKSAFVHDHMVQSLSSFDTPVIPTVPLVAQSPTEVQPAPRGARGWLLRASESLPFSGRKSSDMVVRSRSSLDVEQGGLTLAVNIPTVGPSDTTVAPSPRAVTKYDMAKQEAYVELDISDVFFLNSPRLLSKIIDFVFIATCLHISVLVVYFGQLSVDIVSGAIGGLLLALNIISPAMTILVLNPLIFKV